MNDNVFLSVIKPFRRSLSCKCGYEALLEVVGNTPAYDFKFGDFEFVATCPACLQRGPWAIVDRLDHGSQPVLKDWNPYEIESVDDPLTGEQTFVWKIPDYYRRAVRDGKLFFLHRAPREVIQAIKHDNHLMFDPGVIFRPGDARLEVGVDVPPTSKEVL